MSHLSRARLNHHREGTKYAYEGGASTAVQFEINAAYIRHVNLK